MSALATLSRGVAGLLSLPRRRASAVQIPAIKLPDGAQLVRGRKLRPSLLLPAANQAARRRQRHTLRPPAAAAAGPG
ncbi:hypothetical protein PR202_gb27284 [Eleusine coracana subsp. coracana]|uniref:Uncharacterized protein n=1 Tax=Eleusine coracana subsp. coracana TaxID=191504 RepID=A0AAV5FU30_ELECO|nr:hypothetical protein PR202_gb27284 [Eleusine coracana subsp. coracana]